MPDDARASYVEALEFARGLRAPENSLDFPSYSDYVRQVSQRVDFDPAILDADMADFQEIPEAYELAYLTARLERLQARILAKTGVDVRRL